MFKLILKEASPVALARFINGLFGKDYPPDSEVTFVATESVNEQGDRLGKIVSDMTITIAGDAFLIEAQINDDETQSCASFIMASLMRSRQGEPPGMPPRWTCLRRGLFIGRRPERRLTK
jgi:hypothetical protein